MKALTSTEDYDLLVLAAVPAVIHQNQPGRCALHPQAHRQWKKHTFATQKPSCLDSTHRRDLDVNGEKLSPGNGASTDEEKELHLASEKGAHFLLFDLH
jgi:hypothetical protein